tara:strand:+ start:573 stop:827 length:255 start_codon:yes stop_codon:yes gene_type:complete
MAKEKLIGKITHYFSNIGVAVIKLSGVLKDGNTIHVKGASTDFTQLASSMQIEYKKVTSAKKGDDIGLKVKGRARPGDAVFLVA